MTAPRPGRLISGERSVTPASRSSGRVYEFLRAATVSALDRLRDRDREAGRAEVTVVYDDQQSTAVRAALPVPSADGPTLHALAQDLLARSGFGDDGRGVARVRLTLTLAILRATDPDRPAPVPDSQLALFDTA